MSGIMRNKIKNVVLASALSMLVSSCSFLTVISLDGSTFSVKLDGDFIVLSRDGKEERVGIRK